MTIILVCINNFQEYILNNIELLLKLKIDNINVITNKYFFEKFEIFQDKINLIDSSTLNVNCNYYMNNSSLNVNFRNGFWAFTSLRFNFIYEFMKMNDLKNVFHIENDVLLYYDPSILIEKLENYIYLPFDSNKRGIASIMYIPSHNLLKSTIDLWDYSKNDMENFYYIKIKTNFINHFPIFNYNHCGNEEERIVSYNYSKFDFIFDAAAIGQYLGGVDPNNISGDTTGFINETCTIKYNKYDIFWMNKDDIKKPFIKINNDISPIFNLHIHSKNLKKFINFNSNFLYDIVICVGPNDYSIINETIIYTIKNIIGFRNIYIITPDPMSIKINDKCVNIINDNVFTFNIKEIANKIGYNRSGWYLQQLLKLYAGNTIDGILDNYLVIDSDTFFLKPIKFISDNKYILTLGYEYHKPYFEHMNKLHQELKKQCPYSGISHHFIFNKKIINEMFDFIEKNHNNEPFWKIFINAVNSNESSGASEYELYFTYLLLNHRDKIILRKLTWDNINNLSKIKNKDYDYVSIHWYNRT
jgi:hypothetical protein